MKDDINHIIRHIHKCARNNNVVFVQTNKNRNTIRIYDLVDNERINILLKLKEEHLFKGPIVDKDYPNEYLYVFKYFYKKVDILIYIKIKVLDKYIRVISFHKNG